MTVVPFDTDAESVLAMKPDGVFLSNGPGDPEDVTEVITLVKELRGKLPIFGICLGHQMISLAYGAKTYKLKFGHRGGNHPVKNLATGKIEITSQNHSYAVDAAKRGGHRDLPSRTSICLTTRSRAWNAKPTRSFRCSITPKARPARRTAPICLTSSSIS